MKVNDNAAISQQIQADIIHGNLKTAKQEVENARAALTSQSSADRDWDSKFRLLQAEVLSYQGSSAEVVSLLQCEGVASPLAGDAAIKRYLLCGQAQQRLGHQQLSDRDLQGARQLSTVSHSELMGEVLRTEAKVRFSRNDLAGATDSFQQSLRLARKRGDTFLESTDLLNLGMSALQMHHFDEAIEMLSASAQSARKIHAAQVSQAALGNSGYAYLDVGDFEKALSTFKAAQEDAASLGTTSNEIDWLWDVGVVYSELGNPKKSVDCYLRALEIARKSNQLHAINGVTTELGFLSYLEGHYAAAQAYSDEAIRAAQTSGETSTEVEPKFLQALLATHQPHPEMAEALLLRVHEEATDDPEDQWTIEKALGGFYNDLGQPKKADLWYQKAISTFETQRASLKSEDLRLPFFANGDELYRDYAGFLIHTKQEAKALSLLDQGRARTLEEGLDPASAAQHRKLAGHFDARTTAREQNATILFYSVGPKQSWLWAVNAQQTRLYTLPPHAELKARVDDYNKSLQRSSDPIRGSDGNAIALYGALVAPAISMIEPNARVILIPDGPLNQLNFETLLAPGPANSHHFWIDDVILTNANSIHLLSGAAKTRVQSSTHRLLLVGDPMTNGSGFEALPHAAAEVKTVEDQFPDGARTIVTRSAAVPSAYGASHPEQFAYIHFVAHGTASLLSPLDSAVILSPAPQRPEDFKLYARDIVHHPIHAELVTISACNGSGVRAYAGEGLVGLSWAFLRAGSHNVIGALWQVDDAATPLLMSRLYADLQTQHSPPDVALRNAKLSLLHSSGIYRKPLYWAAFQLYAGS